MADPEFHGNRLAARAAARQRREIGRTICDMHALEQAVADKLLGASPKSCCEACDTKRTRPFSS